MADDMDDIEDLLEAPYKIELKKTESSNGFGNGTNGDSNGNGDHHSTDVKEDGSNGKRDKTDSKSKEKKSRKDRSRSRGERRKHSSRSRSRHRSSRSPHRSSKKSKHSTRSKSKEAVIPDNANSDPALAPLVPSTSSTEKKQSSRDRDRDSTRSDRDRDRHRRHSSRSRSRGGSSRKDKRSSRSRSRSKRQHRSRSHSRDNRDRRDRDRRSPVKPRKERTPELTPEEREFRTVFCMQLAARIRPRDLEDFFSAVGKIKDVRLITDPRTKKSKGIAYIEFKDLDSVPLAIALTGQRLLGVPIIVKLTQAEKNRNPLPVNQQSAVPIPTSGAMKLYVGSLHVNISEEMLRGIFEPFGKIDVISLAKDDCSRSKGFGYIQFANADEAKRAMEQLNGFELANRPMKVTPFNEKAAPDVPGSILSNLDDDMDRTGLNLGPSGKLALMAKLAEGTGMKLPQFALDSLNLATANANLNAQNNNSHYQEAYHPPPVENSPCFLLSNMFDLDEERVRPDWTQEIRDDVIEECSKYGGVVHIVVDQHAPDGNIYVKCSTPAFALASVVALNGRYFAGRNLKASFIPVSEYHYKFPESVSSYQILKPLT